jgi:hypothetical protein
VKVSRGLARQPRLAHNADRCIKYLHVHLQYLLYIVGHKNVGHKLAACANQDKSVLLSWFQIRFLTSFFFVHRVCDALILMIGGIIQRFPKHSTME